MWANEGDTGKKHTPTEKGKGLLPTQPRTTGKRGQGGRRTGEAHEDDDDDDDDESEHEDEYQIIDPRYHGEREREKKGQKGVGPQDTSHGGGDGGGTEMSDLEYLKSKRGTWREDDDDDDDDDDHQARKDSEDLEEEEEQEQEQEQEHGERGVSGEEGQEPGTSTRPRPRPLFIASESFDGKKVGYTYKKGGSGLGYYLEGALEEDAEADALFTTDGLGGKGLGDDISASGEHRHVPEDESLASTGRLFVRNLAYATTEEELGEAFGVYGPLSECHLCVDRELRRPKGFAYVTFANPQHAVAARAGLDMKELHGRLLHVMPGKRAPTRESKRDVGGPGGAGHSAFKAQKEADLKAGAGNRVTWNTLFMRSDTIAEAIAAHYGMTKASLLDRDAADLPVRMALGETWVISETKRTLEDAGVNLDRLEAAAAASGSAATRKSVERSKTTLLVKNLPYSVAEDELVEILAEQGEIYRFVMPPTRTLALVEYTEGADARRAFKALAFRKVHHVPLYMEWAPADTFGKDAPGYADRAVTLTNVKSHQKGAGLVRPSAAALQGAEGNGEGEDNAAPLTSIFVKNISFGSTDAGLRKLFSAAATKVGGSVRTVRIARHKGKTGEMLSRGFGFVDVGDVNVAKKLLEACQGVELDGHALQCQLSRPQEGGGMGAGKSGKESDAPIPKGLSKTKLVVRNLAFDANIKELRQLCSPFGPIKDLRMPRKFDGTPRGFAFVEYASKQEATAALEGLSATHFFGRHLVLERAKENESVEEVRARTAGKHARGEAVENTGKAVKKAKKVVMHTT